MSKLNRKKFSIVVAIFMILMLIFPLFAFASEEKLPFTDVKENVWYSSALEYMYFNGYVTGTTKTTFSPNDNLSRAMLVTILWNMEGHPVPEAKNKFPDVKDGVWYTSPIVWASTNGVVNGNKDGTFAPNANITRQEVAIMLANYCKYKGNDITSNQSLDSFKDKDKVASWAKSSVQWAIEHGVIGGAEGGTKINPLNNATRAEATTMIKNYIDAYPTEKGVYDISNLIKFDDLTTIYDGTEKKVEVTGLPQGVEVKYENNKATDAGTYEATATFQLSNSLSGKYSSITPDTATAKLTITKSIQSINLESTNIKSYRYKEDAVAKISSKITSDKNNDIINNSLNTFDYKVVKTGTKTDAKNLCTVKITPNASQTGTFDINVYATEAGKYTITPVIKGSNIKGGRIEATPINVDVEEVYSITDFKLFNDSGNEIQNSFVLKNGKELVRTIKYYHTYKNGNEVLDTIEIPYEKLDLTYGHVSYTKNDTNNILESINYRTVNGRYVLNDQGEADNVVTAKQNINGIKLKSNVITAGTANKTATVTIRVENNSEYATVDINNYESQITKTLTITSSLEEAKMKGICLNGQKYFGSEQINVNLFTSLPTNSETIVQEENGKLYTILEIRLLDEEGDYILNKLSANYIVKAFNPTSENGKNNVVVYENNTYKEVTSGDKVIQTSSSIDLDVKGFIQDGLSGAYASQSGATKVDYVGIAYNTPSNAESVAKVNQGLTIKFNTLDNSNNVVRGTINVTVNNGPLTTSIQEIITGSSAVDAEQDIAIDTPVYQPETTVEDIEPETIPEEQVAEEPEVQNEVVEEPVENDNSEELDEVQEDVETEVEEMEEEIPEVSDVMDSNETVTSEDMMQE